MPTNDYRVLTINFGGGSDNVEYIDQSDTLEGIEAYDNSKTTLYSVLVSNETMYVHHKTNSVMGYTYGYNLVFVQNLDNSSRETSFWSTTINKETYSALSDPTIAGSNTNVSESTGVADDYES